MNQKEKDRCNRSLMWASGILAVICATLIAFLLFSPRCLGAAYIGIPTTAIMDERMKKIVDPSLLRKEAYYLKWIEAHQLKGVK